MNKKATLDNLYVMVQIFGFAIFLVSVLVAWGYFTDSTMDTEFWDLSTTSQSVKVDAQQGVNQFDNLFMLVYFGYHLGILGLSYFLRSHPVFLVLIILFMVIITIISPILSNTFGTIIAEDEFNSVTPQLPKTLYIMANLPLFELIWVFLTGLIMVGMSRE